MRSAGQSSGRPGGRAGSDRAVQAQSGLSGARFLAEDNDGGVHSVLNADAYTRPVKYEVQLVSAVDRGSVPVGKPFVFQLITRRSLGENDVLAQHEPRRLRACPGYPVRDA